MFPTSVLDGLIEGCHIIGHDGRYVYVNAAAAKQGGQTREALIGKTMAEAYPRLAHTEHADDVQACLTDRTVFHRERSFVTPEGEVVWFELRIQPIPEGVFVLTLDITEKKQAAERQRAADERYRRIVETTSDGIVVVDRDVRITYVNAQFAKMLGYAPEDMLGTSTLDYMDDAARAEAKEKLARRFAGCADRHEHRYRHRTGRDVWVRINATPLTAADGTIDGAMALATDITESRLAEATLRATESRLRQSRQLEAVGSLAGGIAHEFNNLLSVVIGHVDLALDELPRHSPLRMPLQEVFAAAQRGAGLTRQMLAFSRQQVIDPEMVDLNQTLRKMEPLIERVVSDGITFRIHRAPRLGSVFADPGQLEQVVLNLVVNACDAMEEGGALTIETSTLRLPAPDPASHPGVIPGDYAVLTVSDTGCGMDPATQLRVFDPFFTTKPIGDGPGLGLSTVYGIVKQSGGHVGLESAVGHGTTFRIYLPREHAELAVAAQ